MPKSGDPGDISNKSHWPHFKSLLFLKDQLLPRRSTGNLQAPEDDNEEPLSSNETQSQLETGSGDELETNAGDESVNAGEESQELSTGLTPPSSISSSSKEPRTVITKRLRNRNSIDALVAIEKENVALIAKSRADQCIDRVPIDEHQSFLNSLLPHVREIKMATF